MRKRNTLASVVLKRCEIAHRCKDRLEQQALHVWIQLQQLIGGAMQHRPGLPFVDEVEGAPVLGSLSIILASGLEVAKQAPPDLPDGLLHDRASLRFAREIGVFLDQRSHELDQALAKGGQDGAGVAPAAKSIKTLLDRIAHGIELAVSGID